MTLRPGGARSNASWSRGCRATGGSLGRLPASVCLLLVIAQAVAVGNRRETPTASPTAVMWVMGYYVGYHRGIQPPSSVDYSTMTHIIVGPVLPRRGGSFDTSFYIDPVSGPAWARETVERAHTAGIKAILMVGGAGADITAFREVNDPVVRSAFVRNLAAIVKDFGFDGVDMDWEPLSIDGPNPDANDRNRFLALSRDVREAMSDKVMLVPVGWNNANRDNAVNPYYGALAAYYDRINVMSYRMNSCGNWWASWHSSPLFGETASTPSSVDNSVQALRRSGVPSAKIGIGIALVGQPYENGVWQNGRFVHATAGPYVDAPHRNTNRAAIRISDNDVSYSNIIRYYDDPAARRWDDTAKVPYLTFATPKPIPTPGWANPPIRTTYVTYEDERSIGEKGRYVEQRALGGTIVWTISQGYLHWRINGEKDPLMKAVKAAFLSSR